MHIIECRFFLKNEFSISKRLETRVEGIKNFNNLNLRSIVSFVVQKLLILIRSHLFIFAFISSILGGGFIEDPAVIYVGECFAHVLL